MAGPKMPQTGEVGRTGTPVFGGQIYDEYMTELRGSSMYATYEKMRRSDPIISNALDMLKLPILQASWSVEPAEEDEELGEEIAEFVERVLMGDEGSDTWQYILQQALLMLDFGFIPMEKVWELRDRPAALKGTKAPTRVLWLKKLAPRMPYTVVEWVYKGGSPEKGPLLGIRQQLPMGDRPEVPIEKLCIFTHRKEGDNWEGRSVLRSAYKPWFIKDRLEKIDAIGHERMALGIPVFKVLSGFGFDVESEDGKNLLSRCEDIAAHLHANQENYVIEVPGVEFRFEVPKATNTGLLDSINLHGHGILANILAQFMDLGNTETGSRAVAKEQHGPFILGLLSVADNIKATLGRFVVRDLVTYNYGERPGYPSVTHAGVVEADMGPLATMLKDLAAAGFVTPDDDLEAWLRDTLGLPVKPEEEEPEEPELLPVVVPPEGEVPPEEAAPPGGEQPPLPPGEAVPPPGEPAVKAAEVMRPFAEATPFARPPTVEEQYVNFEEIHFHLEASKARFQGVVSAAARPGVTRLVEDAVKASQKGTATKLKLRLPGVPAAAADEISDLADYGARQVAEEHERAKRGTPVRRQPATTFQDEWDWEDEEDWEDELEPLTSEAGLEAYGREKSAGVTALIMGMVLPAIMGEAMRLYRTGADERAALASLTSVADAALDKAVRQAANENVASAFGMGRAMEIEAQVTAGDVVGGYYSCLLDLHACDACTMRDGEYYTAGSVEFHQFEDGNSDECAGGDLCRCMLFLVYSDEKTGLGLPGFPVPTAPEMIGGAIAAEALAEAREYVERCARAYKESGGTALRVGEKGGPTKGEIDRLSEAFAQVGKKTYENVWDVSIYRERRDWLYEVRSFGEDAGKIAAFWNGSNREMAFMAGFVKNDIIRHELGHTAWDQARTTRFAWSDRYLADPKFDRHTAYAKTKMTEGWAEAYMAYMQAEGRATSIKMRETFQVVEEVLRGL